MRIPRVHRSSDTADRASASPRGAALSRGASPSRGVAPSRGRLAAGRSVAVCAVLVLTALASASPAAAINRDDGDDPGAGLSVFETVGLFVALPLLLFALCALYVYAPSSAKGPRYRPGVGWWAQPVWFTGQGRGSSAKPTGSGSSLPDDDDIAPAATGVTRSGTSVMGSGFPATALADSPSGASSLGDEGGGGVDPGHGGTGRHANPEGGASARW